MRKSRVTKAFEQIAVRDGISVSKVREKIQKAIDTEMASIDPTVQEEWGKMPHSGEKPMPEEVIVHLAKTKLT